MTRAGLVRLAVAAAALAAAPLAAQQAFRAGVDVVSLSVTVTDGAQRLVGGLSRDDFQVFEDGALQEITTFSRDPLPIALSLLLDTSASMEQKLGVAQQAAIGFASRLRDDDIAQVIDFDSRTEILQAFTGDRAALERAIRRTEVGGSTSLYNALYVALTELKQVRTAPNEAVRRQAVVVLSDGEDTSSVVPYEQVLELSKRSEVAVYAIGLRSKREAAVAGYREADFVLRTLAQETGGRAFFVVEVHELAAIYQRIADELANQYAIGYTSKNPKRDGAWRRIVVRVTRANVTARTKAGYFGPTEPRR